jgi:methyltransferase
MSEISFSFISLLGLFLLTAVLRLIELFISKRNDSLRSSESNIQKPKEVLFFLFIILHVSFLIFTPLEVYLLNRNFYTYLGISMIILYLVCLLIRVHVLNVLGKNWNTKVIYNPSDELSIITSGIYKFIRHPNYLVVIFELTALSLFHSAYFSFVVFSILNFILLFFRIRFEENELFQNLKYSNHFLDKKRFIPGLF